MCTFFKFIHLPVYRIPYGTFLYTCTTSNFHVHVIQNAIKIFNQMEIYVCALHTLKYSHQHKGLSTLVIE